VQRAPTIDAHLSCVVRGGELDQELEENTYADENVQHLLTNTPKIGRGRSTSGAVGKGSSRSVLKMNALASSYVSM
jgi:hypothetical protein